MYSMSIIGCIIDRSGWLSSNIYTLVKSVKIRKYTRQYINFLIIEDENIVVTDISMNTFISKLLFNNL